MNETPSSAPSLALAGPPAWLANAIFVAFVLGVGGLVLLTGPVPQLLFPSDVLNLLDGSSRQYLGQMVHRDFHSPIGGLAFLPYSLSMHLVGPTARALPGGIALGFLFLAGWTWWLTRDRLPFVERILFLLFVGLLVTATYPLDFGGWRVPSYAMQYNRIGWAWFALVALECFVPVRRPTPVGEWLAAMSTGAIVAMLFLLKFNFFVSAAGLVLCAPLAGRPHRPARWLAGLTGAVTATFAGAWLARIDLAGYLQEIKGMAGSQPGGAYFDVLARILSDNRWWLVAVALVSVGLLAQARRPAPDAGQPVFRATLAFLLIVGAGLALSLTNCQFTELPCFALGLFVLALLLPAKPAGWLHPALRVAALLACLGSILPNAGMLGRAYARQVLGATNETNSLLFTQPTLASLGLRTWPGEQGGPAAAGRIIPKADGSPYAYGLWVQDGIALLAPHITPSSRVLNLDWSNPFPFILGLPPPVSDQIAWAYGRTLSDTHHPDVVALAEQADFIIEPLADPPPATAAFKKRLFSDLMAKSFERVAANRSWILWQRRPVGLSPH